MPPRRTIGDRQTLEDLAALLERRGAVHAEVGGRSIALPHDVTAALREVVAHLRRGDPVTVVPRRAELTTQEAADLLGMSRQHVVRLVDAGRLPARATKVGKHRRLAAGDVLRFKAKREADEARAKEIADLFERTFGPARGAGGDST